MSSIQLNRAILDALEQYRRQGVIEPSVREEIEDEAVRLESALPDRLVTLLERIRALPERKGEVATDSIRTARYAFCVVMPVLNGKKYMDEALESIVGQRGDFEIFLHVQDGGSDDGTIEKCQVWESVLQERCASHAGHVNFSWSTGPDSGLYDALGKGFTYVRTAAAVYDPHVTVCTWLNSDDVLGACAFRSVRAVLTEHSACDWVTGLGGMVDRWSNVRYVHDIPYAYSQRALIYGEHDGRRRPFVQQEGTFWRATLADRTSGVNSSFELAGDWDLWRRFATVTPLVKMEATLAFHRRHAEQLSRNETKYLEEVDATLAAVEVTGLPEGGAETGLRAVFDGTRERTELVEVSIPDGAPTGTIGGAPGNHSMPTKMGGMSPTGGPWPRISIVTPSFNQGEFIEETICSVLGQEYPCIEYIIVDGVSEDCTHEVFEKYRGQIDKIIIEPDGGQSEAINKGFACATGDILCWVNSDDQLAPGALWSVALAFSTSGADLVAGICEIYSNGCLIDRHVTSCKNGPLPLDEITDLDAGWNGGQFFYQPEVFFTRNLWERAGGHVREDYYYSMDYELWCRFAAIGANLHVVATPLARFRVHPEQKTADPKKFKAELKLVHRNLGEGGVAVRRASTRPKPDWSRRLRLVVLNDHGFQYGAGIAHERLTAAIMMAGHKVTSLTLKEFKAKDYTIASDDLLACIDEARPDAIVIGNLHGQSRQLPEIINEICARYNVFWVAHDLWLMTGRCAYTHGCEKYLSGCDASCPTADEYPALEASRIRPAWEEKQKLLEGRGAPNILANSQWTKDYLEKAAHGRGWRAPISPVTLGVPTSEFFPEDKGVCRYEIGLKQEDFVVAFSVSSLSEGRKGGDVLLAALEKIERSGVTLLLIGNKDQEIDLPGVTIFELGYVSDPARIRQAYSAADVYVGPSREETLGQVFLEAAACGTPSIGFDQTGVKDAIVEGITGFRVAPTAKDLAGAILRMYDDPACTKAVSEWAAAYAKNEWSLEASYRSLFITWCESGLIDSTHLPHKISFKKSESECLEERSQYRPVSGISSVEGPYPDLGIDVSFRWCHGRHIKFDVPVVQSGWNEITLWHISPIFGHVKAEVTVDGENVGVIRLKGGDTTQRATRLEWFAWTTSRARVTLDVDRAREPSDHDSRELVFILVDIGMKSLENNSGVATV